MVILAIWSFWLFEALDLDFNSTGRRIAGRLEGLQSLFDPEGVGYQRFDIYFTARDQVYGQRKTEKGGQKQQLGQCKTKSSTI